MRPLARYHLSFAIGLGLVTLMEAIIAVHAWFVQGRPPITHFWAEQMIVVAGSYLTWAHAKAFNKARKP